MLRRLLDDIHRKNDMAFYVPIIYIQVIVQDNYSCKHWGNWVDIWKGVRRKHVVVKT